MRAAYILISFLVTIAIFTNVARIDLDRRRAQQQQSTTDIEIVTAEPAPVTQEPETKSDHGVTVMTIEAPPCSWDAQSAQLSEQLRQQPAWLLSAAESAATDEDLVTEDWQYDRGTPYPSRRNDALDERGLLLLQKEKHDVSIVRRWNPNSGDMATVLLLKDVDITECRVSENANAESENGIFCLVRETSGSGTITDNLVFLASNGGTAMAPLTEARDESHFLVLPDNSVLIVGGRDAASRQRVNTVERVRAGLIQLQVETMADLPGPVRWGYTVAVMQDGRLMVAGGSTARSESCQRPACTDRTYILDVAEGRWTEGPTLTRPRAAATASLLIDGSIMVAGGWTADGDGNAVVTRSTERLGPGENQFVEDAPLPFAMAEHRALAPIDTAAASALLLDEGAKSVIAYDLEQGEWRLAGGFSTFTTFKLGPFSNGREHYFWTADTREEEWSRQIIRVRGYTPATTPTHAGTIHLYRRGTGVLAGENAAHAIVAGGHVSDPFRLTPAVDSFTGSQGLLALSPLQSSRYDAQVFGMRNGAIVVAGGTGTARDDRAAAAMAPHMEFMNSVSATAKWQALDARHPQGTRYAQLNEDTLVAISPGRAVERLTFDGTGADGASVVRQAMPRLPVHRESGSQPDGSVVAIGLDDGRVIVAGGLTYERQIAIYDDTAKSAVGYAGIGELIPANTYEVFDPVSNRWTSSAKSGERGGQVVVLEDGRVVNLHIRSEGLDDAGEPAFTFLFEISHADEGEWKPLPMQEPPYMEAGSTRLVAVGNELFVSGYSEVTIGMERKRVLWWLDQVRQGWDLVWEEPFSSLDSRHQDVIARVSLGDGRELLVPVGGI